MTNKLTTILFLLLGFTFALYGQIEELEPTIEIETVSEGDESTFEKDYNDTWKTPFVSDEMTVDAEQNKSWRMGEYKYNAQPKILGRLVYTLAISL